MPRPKLPDFPKASLPRPEPQTKRLTGVAELITGHVPLGVLATPPQQLTVRCC